MTTGIINVLKPPGMTSHDVVAVIRKIYRQKRVGHAGTLDPAAAGVLPVFVGPATRLIEYTTDTRKSYRVELTFGYETDTGDDTGNVTAISDTCSLPSVGQITHILPEFIGDIEQVPPMHSAIKHHGTRLYELARQGISVERVSRTITIDDIRIIHASGPRLLFDVQGCSKGTYIRTLSAAISAKG